VAKLPPCGVLPFSVTSGMHPKGRRVDTVQTVATYQLCRPKKVLH
jgi:hypothetical protein